jgi:hypothetical protein
MKDILYNLGSDILVHIPVRLERKDQGPKTFLMDLIGANYGKLIGPKGSIVSGPVYNQ